MKIDLAWTPNPDRFSKSKNLEENTPIFFVKTLITVIKKKLLSFKITLPKCFNCKSTNYAYVIGNIFLMRNSEYIPFFFFTLIPST